MRSSYAARQSLQIIQIRRYHTLGPLVQGPGLPYPTVLENLPLCHFQRHLSYWQTTCLEIWVIFGFLLHLSLPSSFSLFLSSPVSSSSTLSSFCHSLIFSDTPAHLDKLSTCQPVIVTQNNFKRLSGQEKHVFALHCIPEDQSRVRDTLQESYVLGKVGESLFYTEYPRWVGESANETFST